MGQRHTLSRLLTLLNFEGQLLRFHHLLLLIRGVGTLRTLRTRSLGTLLSRIPHENCDVHQHESPEPEPLLPCAGHARRRAALQYVGRGKHLLLGRSLSLPLSVSPLSFYVFAANPSGNPDGIRGREEIERPLRDQYSLPLCRASP